MTRRRGKYTHAGHVNASGMPVLNRTEESELKKYKSEKNKLSLCKFLSFIYLF